MDLHPPMDMWAKKTRSKSQVIKKAHKIEDAPAAAATEEDVPSPDVKVVENATIHELPDEDAKLLKKREEQVEELTKANRKLYTALEKLDEQCIKEQRRAEVACEDRDKLLRSIKTLQEEREKLQKDLAESRADLDQHVGSMAGTMNAQMDAVKAEHKVLRGTFKELKEGIASLQNTVKEKDQEIAELKKSFGDATEKWLRERTDHLTLMKRYEEYKTWRDERGRLEAELQEARDQVEAMQAKAETQKAEEAALKASNDKIVHDMVEMRDSIETRVQACEKDQALYRSKIVTLEAELVHAREMLAAERRERDKLLMAKANSPQDGDVAGLRSRNEELEMALIESQARVKSCESDREQHKDIIRKLQEGHTDLVQSFNDLEKQLSDTQSQLEASRQDRQRLFTQCAASSSRIKDLTDQYQSAVKQHTAEVSRIAVEFKQATAVISSLQGQLDTERKNGELLRKDLGSLRQQHLYLQQENRVLQGKVVKLEEQPSQFASRPVNPSFATSFDELRQRAAREAQFARSSTVDSSPENSREAIPAAQAPTQPLDPNDPSLYRDSYKTHAITKWIFDLNPSKLSVKDAKTLLHYEKGGMQTSSEEFRKAAKKYHPDKKDGAKDVPDVVRNRMWLLYRTAYEKVKAAEPQVIHDAS